MKICPARQIKARKYRIRKAVEAQLGPKEQVSGFMKHSHFIPFGFYSIPIVAVVSGIYQPISWLAE